MNTNKQGLWPCVRQSDAFFLSIPFRRKGTAFACICWSLINLNNLVYVAFCRRDKLTILVNFIMAYHYHAINIIKTSHSSLIDWRWGELVIHSKALFFVWGHMWEKYLSIISMLKLWFLQLSLYILQSTMFVHIRHRKQHLPHKLRLSNALNLLWLKAILTIIFRVIPYKKKAMKAS